jgi:NADH:ubiquinone oxidoreductase subunit 6 (subunit J)
MLLGFVAGRIYDAQVLPENANIHQCYGRTCYMYAFVTTSIMLSIALLLVILLGRREKQQDNRRHFELRQKVDVLHL